MLFNFSKGKKHLLLLACLLALGACKQSEFYEKQGLSEVAGTENPSGGTGTTPTDPGTGGGGGTTTPTNPGTGGGGGETTPPVVVVPPVVTPPVVTPPVVEPPVVTPPVVVVPPVVTPPVVEPPVVTPPVVVVPPVVTPPVTPPVDPIILNDRVEKFTQNTSKNGDVDILWVVDDSGSMADEQDSLGRNFNSFINQFLAKDIDFKMAITTTDGTSSRNGKMIGDSSKLTSAAAKANKAEFISNFTKWVKVGTSGSAIEQGFKTSASFMDRYASSFLRPDAYLVIVYLSDEEEQSEKTVADYTKKFQDLKSSKGMFKAYSIITMPSGTKNTWENSGKRYVEMSNATAGTIADIKKDFSGILLDMGGKILNLMNSFALSEAPYNNQVEVYVNSSKVTSGYTFDSAQRTITFDANSVPVEGAQVEVRYKVKATVLGAI